MALLPVYRAIQRIEEGIRVRDPDFAKSLAPESFLIVPDRKIALGTRPIVFENYPGATTEERMGKQREDHHAVKVRLTTHDGNFAAACEMALGFFDAAWDAFDAQRRSGQRLDQTVAYLTLRADADLMSEFEGRPGCEFWLDLVLLTEVEV